MRARNLESRRGGHPTFRRGTFGKSLIAGIGCLTMQFRSKEESPVDPWSPHAALEKHPAKGASVDKYAGAFGWTMTLAMGARQE